MGQRNQRLRHIKSWASWYYCLYLPSFGLVRDNFPWINWFFLQKVKNNITRLCFGLKNKTASRIKYCNNVKCYLKCYTLINMLHGWWPSCGYNISLATIVTLSMSSELPLVIASDLHIESETLLGILRLLWQVIPIVCESSKRDAEKVSTWWHVLRYIPSALFLPGVLCLQHELLCFLEVLGELQILYVLNVFCLLEIFFTY